VTLQVSGATADPAAITTNANAIELPVVVSFAAGVAWTASVDQSWVAIVAGASGVGSETVRIRIAENTNSSARAGTLRIGTISIPITQIGPLRLTAPVPAVEFCWNRDFPLGLEQRVAVVSGGTVVDISATASESWLRVSTLSGKTPDSLTVRVVPEGLADGFYRGRITVRRASATADLEIPVMLTVAPSGPVVTRAGLVSAASLQPVSIVPNQILSLYGTGLQCASPPSILLSGERATVLAATPGQVNFVTPPVLPAGGPLVVYRCADSESAQLTFVSASSAPALFTSSGTGRGSVAAINQDDSFNGSGVGFSAVAAGGVVQLYGTGFGTYRVPDTDGLTRLTQTVRVTVGGVEAGVLVCSR
jgi:uncharacterized protein (TIGR03437 family)